MRIDRIRISHFKALDIEFEWRSPIVLFGKNDAGKTNVLEAIAQSLSSESEPRGGRRLAGEFEALVELDRRDTHDSADNRLLRSLLYFRDAPPVFLDRELESMRSWHWDINDPEWHEEEIARARSFAGPRLAFSDTGTPLDLADALVQLRAHLQRRGSPFDLDRCLASRWLRVVVGANGLANVRWLAPKGQKQHQRTDAGTSRMPAETDDFKWLSPMEDWLAFRPFDVIELGGQQLEIQAARRRVQQFVESLVSGDRLITESGSGFAVHPTATAACAELSEIASEIAPNFIRERYTIVARPFVPAELARSGESVGISLERNDGEGSFDLHAVGSGTAIWAGVALQEAMRIYDQRRTLDPPIDVRNGIELWLQDDRWWHPHRSGRPLLYLIDEPERHLHPAAQEEVAGWVTERLTAGGSQVVLATHALPFLDLGAGTYLRVSRWPDGQTRVEDISSDVLGYLDQQAEASGLGSRAQLLQLTRAALIVEGEHDKHVLEHFYGDELRAQRILLLPIRGAMNAAALIDSEILRSLDIPILILFDNVDAPVIQAGEEPPGSKREASMLWHMLQSWPEGEPPPRVVAFDLPDILCALPEICVNQVLETVHGRRGFSGWQNLIDGFTKAATRDFKSYFAESMQLNKTHVKKKFIDEVLSTCHTRPPVESPLARAIAEVQKSAGLDSHSRIPMRAVRAFPS